MLPKSSRLRRILLAYTVNELGTWFGYVALALGVYDHTRSAIATAGLFIARGLLPALLAPVLVARVERRDKRGLLARLYALEALLTLALAALLWHFWFPGILILVALDGTVAVAATALVRASIARVAAEEAEQGVSWSASGDPESVDEAQRQANATLNVAFMVSLAVGPAIGGVLVHTVGGPVALLLDALTFLACALLMIGLRAHVEDGGEASTLARLRAAWQHLQAVPLLRALLITEAVAVVFFASVEPVEVVYVKSTLHAGDLGFGLLVAEGVISGPLRFLAHHKWIYDIVDADRKRGIITAYVMTNIVDSESRIIMYGGRLHDIFLSAEGSISYLILKNCSRYYMTFKDGELVTSKQLNLFSKQGTRPANVWDRLLIEGTNIANVLFDSSPEIKGQAEGAEALDRAFQQAMERLRQAARSSTPPNVSLPGSS